MTINQIELPLFYYISNVFVEYIVLINFVCAPVSPQCNKVGMWPLVRKGWKPLFYTMSLIRNYLIMNIPCGLNETIYILFVLIRLFIIVSVL